MGRIIGIIRNTINCAPYSWQVGQVLPMQIWKGFEDARNESKVNVIEWYFIGRRDLFLKEEKVINQQSVGVQRVKIIN